MVKKVLFVATVFRFLHFEKSDMEILKKKEYEIHTATNMTGYDWLSDDGSLDYLELHKHQIDFGRSPFSKNTFEAYRQLKVLLKEEHFDVIHTHTPVASAILRLAAISTRRKGTKVIYTDHGFHFHKSSPRKNWILYYPMEYILAYYSDMIITINREDYNVIQNFPVKKKKYIPSVGVDIDSIANLIVDKKKIRGEFNIPEDVFLILSIGELSIRKNQEVIIRALSNVKNSNVYYLLCGTGDRQSYLENLTKELGVNDRVIFAGYQTHDKVKQIAHSADLGALPSLIEGSAASASAPRKRPTTQVSAMLYICCSRLPNISGRANSRIFFVMGPWVRLCCMGIISSCFYLRHFSRILRGIPWVCSA